jgi:hypothetical protein
VRLLAKLAPRRAAIAVFAVAGCVAAVAVPGAAGSASSDLNAIAKDYQADGKITPCIFTKGQLENAKSLISGDIDAYAPEFRTQINSEISRWDSGGCSGASIGSSGLKIVKTRGKGSARKEYVTIKNGGSKKVNLKGYALRNAKGKKLRFKTVRIAKGKKLKVTTGCAKHRKKASHTAKRYYGCKKKQLWKDKGDVAELLNKSGTVVARRRT